MRISIDIIGFLLLDLAIKRLFLPLACVLALASNGVTIPDMANKKNPGRRPKPPASKTTRTPNYTIYARINPAIGAALEAYLSRTKPKPSQKAVIEVALEEFLTQKGFNPEEYGEGATGPGASA